MGWYPWYRSAHGDSNGVPCPYSLGRSASLTSYGSFATQRDSLFSQTGNLCRKSPSHSPNAKGHAGVESGPGPRVTTAALVRLQTRWALRRLAIQPFAVVATYPGDLLGSWGGNVVNVFYGTDDYVAGAELMGLSVNYQIRQEIRIVGQADVVAAVSPQLAERWAGFRRQPCCYPWRLLADQGRRAGCLGLSRRICLSRL